MGLFGSKPQKGSAPAHRHARHRREFSGYSRTPAHQGGTEKVYRWKCSCGRDMGEA